MGRADEISRYQIRKTEWWGVTNSTCYRHRPIAWNEASRVLEKRLRSFQPHLRRPLFNFEFHTLWNAPLQALLGRLSRMVAERYRRFAHLCAVEPQPNASLSS